MKAATVLGDSNEGHFHRGVVRPWTCAVWLFPGTDTHNRNAPPVDYFPSEYRKPARLIDADLRNVQVRIANEGERTGPIELVDPYGEQFIRGSTAERVRGASLSSELEKALAKAAANGGVFDASSAHHVNLRVTVLRLEHFKNGSS